MNRLAFVWLVIGAAWGQTLEIPAVTVERGKSNIIRILLTDQTDRPLTALQWELLMPPPLLLEPTEVVLGSAASSVEKSVTCSNRTDAKDGKVCVCILAGSLQALRPGVIAIVKFTAVRNAHQGQAIVHFRKLQGVSKDLKSVPIPDANVSVTIR